MPQRLVTQVDNVPAVSLVAKPFKFQSTKLGLVFNLPQLKGAVVQETPPETIAEAVTLHSKFCFEVLANVSHDEALQRGKAEVKVVLRTFPKVREAAIIASMSAWFFLLCYIDDVVEHMSPDAAQMVLGEISNAMTNSRERDSVTSGVDMSDALPEAKLCCNADQDCAGQIRDVVACFQRHLTSMLSTSAYDDLCNDMNQVFEAMVTEIDFRQQERHELSQYLRIREKTIGLAPLFNLLRIDHGCPSSYSANLMFMELCVRLIVGMQNDVVGLEKDVLVDEFMNYPMVYTDYQGGMELAAGMKVLEHGILAAVENHNMTVDIAIDLYRVIATEMDDREARVASSMLVFVSEHFRWSTQSARYKS